MYKKIQNAYLVLAILAIITAIPLIGFFLDFLNIFTFGMGGLAIYIILCLSTINDSLRLGAILMLVACGLTLLGSIILFLAPIIFYSLTYSYAHSDFNYINTDYLYNFAFVIDSFIFLFIGWCLKITAIVFCFKNYTALSKLKEK